MPFHGKAINEATNDAVDIHMAKLVADRFSREDNAYQFNGASDFIEFKKGLNVKSDFSFCFWIFPEDNSKEQMLFSKGEDCPDGNLNYKGSAYSISLLANGMLSGRVVAPNGNHADEDIRFTSKVPLKLNKWSCVAVVFDMTSRKFNLIVNDEWIEVANAYRTNANNFNAIYQTAASFKMGADESYCGYKHRYDKFFKGKLDDIRIYNRILSSAELSEFYDCPPNIPLLISVILILVLFAILLIRVKKPSSLIAPSEFIFADSTTKIILSLMLSCFYFLVFSHTADFSNDAYFGGDTWEYQSMAVNYAKGHGIQKFGGLEKFETYKFDQCDSVLLKEFNSDAGRTDVYRTPAYPLFIGTVYKLFGVDPAIAKEFQLILLILVASFLPWIGMYFSGRIGLLSGLIASPFYLLKYYMTAQYILTEPMITFMVFLIIITYIFHDRKNTVFSSVALGVILGSALLTKGSLIFIPLFICLYSIWKYFKTKEIKLLAHLFYMMAALSLTILPWSIYASSNEGELVLLSTQGKTLLLDCNNENTIDGQWHPEWRHGDTNMFYNHDNMQTSMPLLRVINFYTKNDVSFISSVKNKILTSHFAFPFLWLMIALFFAELIGRMLSRWTQNKSMHFLYAFFGSILLGLIVYGAFVIDLKDVQPNYWGVLFCVLTAVFMCLAGFTKAPLHLPVIFHIIFLNIFLVTVVAWGAPRFVEVIDFVFILYGIQWVIRFVMDFVKSIQDYY